MVQDVRSSATGVAFDLLSQEGVMRALQFVRASLGSPLEKRELRDLIFSYTNTGGDPALRTLIEQRLIALPVAVTNVNAAVPSIEVQSSTTTVVSVPTVVPASVTPVVPPVQTRPAIGFGASRPTPHFAPVQSVVAQPVAAPAPTLSPVVTLTADITDKVLPVLTDVSVSSESTHIQPLPPLPPIEEVVANPLSVVESVVPPLPVFESKSIPAVPPLPDLVPMAEILPPTVSAGEPVPQPEVTVQTPVPSLAASPVPQPVSPEDMVERYRMRIAEIKQSVNSQVGNPVNLINLNREIGSTYMTNLLSAMKAVTGAAGDPVAAMRALEESYKEVTQLFIHGAVVPGVKISSVQSEVIQSSQPETVSGFTQAFTEPEVPVAPVGPTPVISPLAIQRRDIGPIPSQTPTHVSPVVPIIPDAEAAVVPITSSRTMPMAPVAEVAPLKTPQDLPTAAQKKAELGITDPLLDPDVDTGLDQLLSEWAIFKKSGMFGTGPRGRQHPLFQKLAPINMVLIVSGRFEGATSEIRQSITDYMNGWRYEQGITYENDENFEHYLRRVVRHILDLQYNRRTS